MLNKIIKILKNPSLIVLPLGLRNRLKWMSDEMYLKLSYKATIGNPLNLDNPEGFNEKLQWLKLHDRNPEYVRLVDKCEVKKWAAKKIGEDHVIPTIGVYSSFDDIDPKTLPNAFAIKSTHDSGGFVICHDKKTFDWDKAKKKINKSLKRNFFYAGREWPYKNVRPRIIIEENVNPDASQDLMDYKFMCFNGEVKCLFVCSGRAEHDLRVDFFDCNWNRLPFERHYKNSDITPACPENLVDMIALAEILSEGIPFVRVDFYSVEKTIYFGEMTFYPGGGFEEFSPEEWDNELGSWISLPQRIQS